MPQPPKTAPKTAPATPDSAETPAPKPRAPRKRKQPAPPRFPMRLSLIAAIAVFLLDQISKYVVVHILRLERVHELNLIDPYLNLRMAWNQGVNFGLLSSGADIMRWVLIAVSLTVSLWVWIWLKRAQSAALCSRLTRVAAGLLIGGALGNAIDRLTYGAVADFLNMSLPGWQNPYSFNIADIAIFAGAIGLVMLPPGTAAPKSAASSKSRDARRK